MLGILNARPKPWIVTELSFSHASAYHRLSANQLSLLNVWEACARRNHSTACRIHSSKSGGGAGLIWHALYPSGKEYQKHDLVPQFYQEQKGEGSWNVPWDVRPARWLHNSDSAWLLFGVCACACLAPLDLDCSFDSLDVTKDEGCFNGKEKCPLKYRVIGEF